MMVRSTVLAAVLVPVIACSSPLATPTPTPYPATTYNLSLVQDRSAIVMRVGETVLVPSTFVANEIFTVVAEFPHAMVLRAAAPGRAYFKAEQDQPNCQGECAALRAPEWEVLVVSYAADLLTVTDLDSRWNIRVSLGQRIEVTMDNFPNQPAWATLDTKDTAVLVPSEAAVVTTTGIRRVFTAGAPGTAFVALCPKGGCPENNPTLWWRFIVSA